MNDQPGTPAPSPPTPEPVKVRMAGATLPLPKSWRVALVVAAIMLVLALVGVGLSTASRQSAPTYWMALVPVYGVLCIGVAWYRSREGESGPRVIVRQVFHWLIITGAVALDFLLRGSGEESGMAAGLNALLLLAIGCFLAGVHFEWLFSLVGLLLVLTLIVVVEANQYLWLVFIVGALLVVAMFAVARMIHRYHVRKDTVK